LHSASAIAANHGVDVLLASLKLPGTEDRLFSLWLPFGFLGLIAWTVWLGRRFLTSFYRPIVNDHWEEASVVAPCFREEPEILEAAVRTWLLAGAYQVVLVFPEDDNYALARAKDAFCMEPRVRHVTADTTDKRLLLEVGIRAASREIVVLSDSDTVWEEDLLRNLVMPFADPSVGGVGTRQRVLEAHASMWRRAADWQLDAKYLTYVPAMARKGGVSCLSGRTVAYRRPALLEVLPELVNETFRGRRCISGDDGRLTWLFLNRGYKTAYQQNAVAWTMMPDTARGFFMQRLRWSRNSYRCYLRAVFRGWLFHQPAITIVSVLQGLVSPLSLTIGFVFVGLAISRGDMLAMGVWAAWILTGRGIRAIDHLREQPRNIVLLPLMTVIILFVMTALKYYTFFTMNKQAWITRRQDRGVAEGQSIGSLNDGLNAALVGIDDPAPAAVAVGASGASDAEAPARLRRFARARRDA